MTPGATIAIASICGAAIGALAVLLAFRGAASGARVADLEHQQQLIKLEWTNTIQQLDRVCKRLARYDREPVGERPAAAAAVTADPIELRRRILLQAKGGG